MKDKRDLIFGIKSVAEFLETSERNVYRWEKELGLPLHRVAGSSGRTVYVSIEEIRGWLENKPICRINNKKRSKKITIGITLIVICAISITVAIALILKGKTSRNPDMAHSLKAMPDPRTASVEDKNVFVKDENGNVIWSYIENDVKIDSVTWDYNKQLDFYDIDNDNANEVIAKEYDVSTDRFYLTLFDNDGARIWRKQITNNQSFNGLLLATNFQPCESKFARLNDGRVFILSAWRHRARFLIIITRYDLDGNILNNYVHTGHLTFLVPCDLNNDGNQEILFGGTNNLLNGEAVIGVLPLEEFKGVCPPRRIEPEYTALNYILQKYVADNPEEGNELFYLRFRRTSHFAKFQAEHIFPYVDAIEEDLLHLRVKSWQFWPESDEVGFEYVFGNRLELMDVLPLPMLRKFHSQLCEESNTDISMEKLTKIYSENIYLWK
ncbi:MAG: hypothetical protein OEW18_07050, partial [Candidatus Aminicenantes bacterium]|nr:hypothetical protein [Candidatus Aminicenantes bacterium]